MHNFDFSALFATIATFPPLAQTDPRQGCIARTQIIGSLLHAGGCPVGRAWILPVYETDSFIAPLCDAKGQPIRLRDPETGVSQLIRWRFHCATLIMDETTPMIADFPLFETPVPLPRWQSLFEATQERHTSKGAAPCALRFVNHEFAHIPQRQVLLYNPQAEKQNKLLPLHRLVSQFLTKPLPRVDEPVIFTRHKGEAI